MQTLTVNRPLDILFVKFKTRLVISLANNSAQSIVLKMKMKFRVGELEVKMTRHIKFDY